MCRDYVEEKKELIRAIPKDRKLSDIPKITQVVPILLNFSIDSRGKVSSDELINCFHLSCSQC